MTSTPDEALELLRKIRMDLTNAQAKITDAMNAIASLPQPAKPDSVCHCGVRTRGPLSLQEHIHTSHGGPLPEHWARAERLAGIVDE